MASKNDSDTFYAMALRIDLKTSNGKKYISNKFDPSSDKMHVNSSLINLEKKTAGIR